MREGERIMTLCNACRYCEGYCAVFTAMERRTVFSDADLNYLSNLCHNCGECYYACPYTPPHEYALNVPQTLAQIRTQSYVSYAPAFGKFRYGPWLALAVGAVGVFLVRPGRVFYDVIPHEVMAFGFSAVGLWVFVALFIGLRRFGMPADASAWITAAQEALRLKYMDRGPRRWFHHATFYGFALCFASTSFAAFYHFFLDLHAPYPFISLPVLLGTLGGIGLVAGTTGLFWVKQTLDSVLVDSGSRRFDEAFIAALWLTGVTGLALEGLRGTAAMPALLVIHLAVVLALFLAMPYGKFVHGFYRLAALARNARESVNGQHADAGLISVANVGAFPPGPSEKRRADI
jgi:citrate/tricarballylate utilization protein